MCASAAVALVNLGNSNPDVVSALLDLVRDDGMFVNSRVAGVLGELAKTSDIILPEVLQWLEQNRDWDVMGNAIDCLWSIVVE